MHRGPPWVLVSLVGLGAVLRFWGLGANRLGFDESFTAMAARRPVGELLDYLRVRDSHPPLDYLLHAPLARAGVDEFWFRFPSVVFSVAALALFAWWVRRRGFVGILATALLAVDAFQLVYGREARMYAEMELIGVLAAVLADTWLRRPRPWHASAIGVVTTIGLFTHTSMLLLGAGLLLLAGRRNDREAWRWRLALAAAFALWVALWGPSFVVQAGGGHSEWIPRTTLAGLVHVTSRLVTFDPVLQVPVFVGVVAGAILLSRSDRALGRVWACCVGVPVVLAAVTGTVAPVLLDRTLTVVSWGPVLALAALVGAATSRRRFLAVGVAIVLSAAMIPAAIDAVRARSVPDRFLRHIEQVTRPGDVVALHPSGLLHEISWSIGVRGPNGYRPAPVVGLGNTTGIALDPEVAPTGRVWVLDWASRRLPRLDLPRCAPDWAAGHARLYCFGPVVP